MHNRYISRPSGSWMKSQCSTPLLFNMKQTAVLSLGSRSLARYSTDSGLSSGASTVSSTSSQTGTTTGAAGSESPSFLNTPLKLATKGEAIPEAVARKVPALAALHARLELGESFAYSTLARSLINRTATVKYLNNEGMAHFGKNLLSFHLYEHFMVKYPRLPPNVLKHVVGLYTSVNSLTELGKSWGVEADTSTPFTRYIADIKDEELLGKLLYTEEAVPKEDGVVEISNNKSSTNFNGAMGNFVRALASGIYAHNGLEAAKQFIYKFVIQPKKLDMSSILAFSQPTRELAMLCAREGLEPPVSRLIAETGRYSKAPVFVVGAFSGKNKMGEGHGASLKEARTRAAVHSLKSWYLYSPVNPQLPSDITTSEYKGPEYVDPGVVIV